MLEWIISLSFPRELLTFLIALLPIFELRGAIPVALGVFDLPVSVAFFWSWLGSVTPAVAIVYGLGYFSKKLSERFKFFKNFFDWLFERTHRRFWKHHRRLGALALIVFVAIPLPVTGVWTGSVAAFLFKIPKEFAILYICLGSMIAGVIVTLIYMGAFSFIQYFI